MQSFHLRCYYTALLTAFCSHQPFLQKLNHGQAKPAPNFIHHSVSGYYTAVSTAFFALTNPFSKNLTMVKFLGRGLVRVNEREKTQFNAVLCSGFSAYTDQLE